MKHFPECRTPAHFKAGCICDRLQACRTRVLREVEEAASRVQQPDDLWLDGYEHGLRDAYDIVDKGGRAAAQIEALARLKEVTL